MHRLFNLSFVYGTASLVMLSASMHAGADGLIDIKPYVSATATYDDNLLRFSGADEAQAAIGTDDMSDIVRRTDVGVDADWKISRQHLLLALNLNRNRYNRFDFLNNNGDARKLAWDWAIGSHLGGEMSASENNYISGFTEVQSLERNERSTKNRLLGVNWDFHPRWQLQAKGEEFEFENSSPSYRSSDKEVVAHDAAIQYTTPSGNRMSLSAREVATEYPELGVISGIVLGNSKSRQLDKAFNFAWQLDGKTRVNGRLAWVELKFEELSQRNVETWAGRLEGKWQPSGKTTLLASAVRDIYGVDDIAATYTLSDAFIVSTSWAATAKLMVQARASYEKLSYQSDPGFLLGLEPQRVDKLQTANLSVSYALHDKVRMQVSWQKESRDSSVVNGGYLADIYSANVRFDF